MYCNQGFVQDFEFRGIPPLQGAGGGLGTPPLLPQKFWRMSTLRLTLRYFWTARVTSRAAAMVPTPRLFLELLFRENSKIEREEERERERERESPPLHMNPIIMHVHMCCFDCQIEFFSIPRMCMLVSGVPFNCTVNSMVFSFLLSFGALCLWNVLTRNAFSVYHWTTFGCLITNVNCI